MLAALTHRDFRLYWSGFVTAVFGMQMFMVVQAWLVYDLTGSALYLGLAALARAVPSFALGLLGGVVADKVNQRRLLIATTASTAMVYFVLATVTFSGTVQVWHILMGIFLAGGIQSFDQATRQSIFPNLIDRRHMASAVALNSTIHPGTRIFAPVVAGFLIDNIGVSREGAALVIYLVAAAYITFSFLMFRVRLPSVHRSSGTSGIQDLVNGMKYILKRPVFRMLIATSYVNAFFGMSHITLMPIFAEILGGAASGSTIALLFSAAGIGGLMGTLIGGSLGNIRRTSWLILGGAGGFGVALITFAFSPWFGLSVFLEWLSSVCLSIFAVTAQTTLHNQVPDEYRGRVMGIWGMTHTVMQPLGGLAMGVAAGAVGAVAALAFGGSFTTLFAVFGAGREKQVRDIGSRTMESQVSAGPSDHSHEGQHNNL